MPRAKKPHLKKRKDGYYVCRYKDQWFYGITEDDALSQREEYKRLEVEEIISIPTVREYSEKWIVRAYPSVAKTTMTGLRIHMKKLTDSIGNVMISEVKPSQIKAVYSEKYIGMSNSYIKAGKQLFCALFDAAVADGYLRANPARDKTAQPHKGSVGGYRAITPQEREWILTYCHDHRAYPAVITMLYAGIRPQEAKALTIEKAYDKKECVLHIKETAHRNGNNQYVITEKGKTKNAIRDVPVFPPVEEALKGRSGPLIASAGGEQITSTTWRNAMESYRTCMETAINGCPKRWYGKTKEHKKILAEGGELPPWIEFNVVPYDLRHSFCTWGRDNGVELHTMIDWMGHADATMIMRIYDEVTDDRSKIEAEKLKKTAFRSANGSIDKNETPKAVDPQQSQLQ